MISLEWSRPSSDPLDEDMAVLRYMRRYGIENVRGGSYSQVDLPSHQLQTLNTQLLHAAGKCLKCGESGHFAADCGLVECLTENSGNEFDEFDEDACWRCGRMGHWAGDCYARKDVNGRYLRG